MSQTIERENRCLVVTGANGFLGSEVVRRATAAGLKVRATDLGNDSLFSDVDYCCADILDPRTLARALEGMQGEVIHAAGLAHIFDKSQASVAPFKAINEIGTANVARAAAEAGVRHFILISSVSVYGPFTQAVCDETALCCPEGPYAESKYQAEQRAIEIAQQSGMSLTILRLATLYGEGDPGNVARLMRTIERARFIWIGNASNLKSLLYRGDAARACIAVLCQPALGINIYNVSAPPCMMREVVDDLASALGRRVPRWHVSASLALRLTKIAAQLAQGRGRMGSLHATLQKWLADDVYDASKFQQTFNFHTQVELAEGLRQEVAWYRNQTR